MSDEINPIDALADEESAKKVASLIENATANGISAMASSVSRTMANHVATIALLSALGGNKARQEDSVEFGGNKLIVPEQYRGNLSGLRAFVKEYEKAQNTKTDMVKVFDYRVYDVAHALHLALKEYFGFTGNGEVIKTPFGDIEPEIIEVKTGIGQHVQVPYNRLSFLPLQGHIDIGFARTPKGVLGKIKVNAPKGFRDAVEGLFELVEDNLRKNSIYRGKAIVLDEGNEIDFLDLSTVRREDVVYSPEVMDSLEANLWLVIRNMEEFRAAGLPIKRSVLLEGPYGTGKSMAAFLTALECVANGLTFIFVKPGADLNDAMQMTQLYAPAVVFFEDVDVLQSNDPEKVSELLDTFDGLSSKGKEIIAVLTTNNKKNIHKGMLRPGRLDTLIHIGAPNLAGVRKIIESKLRSSGVLLDEVDFEAVYAACKDYMPAFVGEVAQRSLREAWMRENGKPAALYTDDLLKAASGIREQFDLMVAADEIRRITPFQDSFREELREVFREVKPLDANGDPSWGVNTLKIDK